MVFPKLTVHKIYVLIELDVVPVVGSVVHVVTCSSIMVTSFGEMGVCGVQADIHIAICDSGRATER